MYYLHVCTGLPSCCVYSICAICSLFLFSSLLLDYLSIFKGSVFTLPPPPPFFGHVVWLTRSQFHKKGLNPGPQEWKHGILTTGLPENYLSVIDVLSFIYTLFLNVTLWFILCISKVSHIISNDMLELPESYNNILLFSPSHFLCHFYLRFFFSTCITFLKMHYCFYFKQAIIFQRNVKWEIFFFNWCIVDLGFPSGLAVKCPPAVQESQEVQVRSLGQEDPPEAGTATHSSILAWRMPWTEEPGRLQSIWSQRVSHNWSNLAHTHA